MSGGRSVRSVLFVRPPFDPAPAFAFLAARSVAGAEVALPASWVRAVSLEGRTGWIRVEPSTAGLVLTTSAELAPARKLLAAKVRYLFDLDADPSVIAAHLSRDPLLRRRVAARPALRVMHAFDRFEWAARAVIGQQVSVRAARTLAARLVARFGTSVNPPDPGIPAFAWPTAPRLAEASIEALGAIGLTRARARTLHGLAAAVADGRIDLDSVPVPAPAAVREALLALPGIGPWTADYIALRALGSPDAFPSGDLGIRKALGGISAAEAERRAERWRPFRAYAAAHLWLGTPEETV
jgi:AraC family transcriptional regulator of adaptative response / DNA-3-methyladenine glycosylase II